MTGDLRVAVYPADESGCGYYRMIWPAMCAAQPGVDVLLGDDAPALMCAWSDQWDHTSTAEPPSWVDLIGLAATPDIDVAVLQRPLTRWKADLVGHLQAAGIAVVVELDDDFTSIDQRNPAWPAAQRYWWPARQAARHMDRQRALLRRPERAMTVNGDPWWYLPGLDSPSSEHHLARACAQADLVTCSTRAIADWYAPHGRVAVLPNCVPAGYLNIDRQWTDRLRVGWTGSVATHPGDLETVRAVGDVLNRTGLPLTVVGTGVGIPEAMGCQVDPCGWVPIGDYPHALAEFDVGICPLADTRFNRAKSWLKPLEMSALGVAWVAADLPEYRRLHQLGAGDIASSAGQWRRKLGRLIVDPQARAEQVARNRAVAARLTYERHGYRWAQAWIQAAGTRATAGKVAA